MKRVLTVIMCLLMALSLLSGCDKNPEGGASTQPDATSTETSTPAPTSTAAPSGTPTAEPTTAPSDPGKVFAILDFNDVTSPEGVLNPLDLSSYGIGKAQMDIVAEEAEEGKAVKVTLPSSGWCQCYQITDGKLLEAITKEAKTDYYFRIYVSNPNMIEIAFTIGLFDGSKGSFLDSTKAIVTETNGKSVECATGNATSDAGPDSSLTIPAEFTGWIAWPLSELKAWASNAQLTDFATVTTLRIDVRPQSPQEDDYYVLDNICIASNPAGVATNPTTTPSPEPTETNEPTFKSKNEELAYMMEQFKKAAPEFEYCPEYDPVGYPNIKAIWFTGAKFGKKDTKVFAYIGFPSNASASNKVPAVVLHHGGGGYAYPSWVKIWNDKGYAAIAICNTGYYPAKEGITDFYSNSSWRNSLTKEMREKDPRVLAPNNDGMFTSKNELNRQWMYHAVAQTIIANNILRNDERVDASKVGLTGISWGGVITSVAMGYDDRFAFAIPVYGSGYLNESLAWMKDHFNAPGTKELWEPSLKLKDVKMPILWLAWTNDSCFSINSQDKSFADTADHAVMTFLMNMGHGHIEGWTPVEIYRFADWVVKNGQPLTTCATQPGKSTNISFTINKPSDATSVTAKAYYLTEKMTYSSNGWQQIPNQTSMDQKWASVDCTVNGNTITAKLPSNAYSYYVEITTTAGGKKYVTCSRYIVIKE